MYRISIIQWLSKMIEVSVGGSDAKLIPLKRLKQIVNLSQTVLDVSYFISYQKGKRKIESLPWQVE